MEPCVEGELPLLLGGRFGKIFVFYENRSTKYVPREVREVSYLELLCGLGVLCARQMNKQVLQLA